MKKRLSLLLLVCLLLPLGLWACTENSPETPPNGADVGADGETNPDTGDDTNTEKKVEVETLTIAGEDISKFTIEYVPSYTDEFVEDFGDYLVDDYDHNYETAYELKTLISKTCGVTLPVVAKDASETECKIIIGASAEGFADNEYAVRLEGKTLVITGGSDGAVYHAFGAIKDAFSKTTVADVVWNEGELFKGEAKMKRIACIGDSLTEGSIGGHVTPELAYPAALQRLLWKEYNVYNYGLGGTTMIGSSTNPYMSSKQYSDCLSSGMTYDVILVMLGTNDPKAALTAWQAAHPGETLQPDEVEAATWTAAYEEEFLECAETLFASLKEKSPNARFAFMNCPVKFTPDAYGNAYMLPLQKEAARMLKGEGFDVTHYDMRAYTTEVLTQENFPKDGLHPNYEGYSKIAEGVLDLVYHLTDGDENKYIISLD